MNIYYVYAYLRKSDNTPYYIGKGKGNRAWDKGHSCTVPNDTSKIVLLKENIAEQEALNLEIELIAQYGRKDLGTGILRNLTDGGEGSRNMSKLVKDKISMALKGRKVPAETITKRLKTIEKLGKISPLKGRPLADWHKEKVSQSLIGINAGKPGRVWTELERNKLKKPKPKVECPYCNKIGGLPQMKQYHFEKCKTLKEEI
jgi:hypothetical protein